jgi:fumarate reductase flavoprotein subunit
MRQADDEARRIDHMRSADRGTEQIADIAKRCSRRWRTAPESSAPATHWPRASTSWPELQQRLERVQFHDQTLAFNTELVAALELANMLDIAEVTLHSALQREESRGAHQRTDFTARDDTRFLNHALAYRDSDGSVRIERLPVTITRWPPGERVYGR